MLRDRIPSDLPLALLAGAVVAAVSVPLIFVVVQVTHAGWGPIRAIWDRPIVGELITHTVELTASVTVTTGVLGFGAAFLVERTDVPLRHPLAVALVLPLAVPEFVQGFSWVSLTSGVRGYWGAVIVMSCGLYPLVYLPVAATLRRADPALEDVSRSLGRGRWATLGRVTLPLCRPALGGGALLVGLYLLGEYGAFAALNYRTFATAIYTEYHTAYDTAGASVLTLALCGIALLLMLGEGRLGARGDPRARSRAHGQAPPLIGLGWARWPALAALVALLAAALGVPIAALVTWFADGTSSTLPPASILTVVRSTLVYALTAAAVATCLALPVALYAWRRRTRTGRVLERTAYLTRAVPGIAIGLSLIQFTIRYARPYYEQGPTLVAGYVVLFFPLALTGVRAGLATVPPGVEEVGRSLGVSRLRVLARITLPLVAPGLGVAAALVTLSATTELTATLLLRPIGTETLATRFWAYTSGLAYGQAAPYAAIMIGISVVPVLLLARRGALR